MCITASKAVPALGAGTVAISVRVADVDVVWLRSVLEAYDGLGTLYGDGSGMVLLLTTDSRADELKVLLGEIRSEIGLEVLSVEAGLATFSP